MLERFGLRILQRKPAVYSSVDVLLVGRPWRMTQPVESKLQPCSFWTYLSEAPNIKNSSN